MRFNESLLNLENGDSFYLATKMIREYKDTHPNNKVVSLGIGDVSFPICKVVEEAMQKAVIDEANEKTFTGYGSHYGIKALRTAIRDNEYPTFSIDEIYVSQGTKSDVGDILELFSSDVLVGIPNPTYPIYKNACISLNKNYEEIPCDDNFIPQVPTKHFDVIYLCSPNNPTGISYTYDELKKWIDYAIKEDCVILYDNVYFKFIEHGVKSIYEVEGAKKCSIEFRSFSKHASFTGIRCSYYVIPNELNKDINKYWRLRTINRFNGASYVSQIGALATFEKAVKDQLEENIKYYKDNASYLRKAFIDLGYQVYGGLDAPYLWIKCPKDISGWSLFNSFLNELEVVIVPGSIFGNSAANYFRVSALGKKEDIIEAIERIKRYEQKTK